MIAVTACHHDNALVVHAAGEACPLCEALTNDGHAITDMQELIELRGQVERLDAELAHVTRLVTRDRRSVQHPAMAEDLYDTAAEVYDSVHVTGEGGLFAVRADALDALQRALQSFRAGADAGGAPAAPTPPSGPSRYELALGEVDATLERQRRRAQAEDETLLARERERWLEVDADSGVRGA